MQRLPILIYPKIEEVKYKRFLLRYVRDIEFIISKDLFPNIKLNQDAFVDDVNEVFSLIKDKVSAKTAITIAQSAQLLKLITSTLVKRVRRNIKTAKDLRISSSDDLLTTINNGYESTVNANVSLITSISDKLLSDVAITIDMSFKEGWSVAKLKNEIKTKFNISDNRAKLIARDQIGKLSSFVIRTEHESVGITEYIWSTSHDDRVRASHKVLNNKVCQWDNPNTYRDRVDGSLKKKSSIAGVDKQVGEDFQCRCSIIAII